MYLISRYSVKDGARDFSMQTQLIIHSAHAAGRRILFRFWDVGDGGLGCEEERDGADRVFRRHARHLHRVGDARDWQVVSFNQQP